MEFLVFDILGDLSFGVDFKTKEPGENKLKRDPKDHSGLHDVLLSRKSFLFLSSYRIVARM